jgi:hypothetical protein
MSEDVASAPTFPGASGFEFPNASNTTSGDMTVENGTNEEELHPKETQSDAMEVEASEGGAQDEHDVEREIEGDTSSENKPKDGTEGEQNNGMKGENEHDIEDEGVDEDGLPILQDPSGNIIVRGQQRKREILSVRS